MSNHHRTIPNWRKSTKKLTNPMETTNKQYKTTEKIQTNCTKPLNNPPKTPTYKNTLRKHTQKKNSQKPLQSVKRTTTSPRVTKKIFATPAVSGTVGAEPSSKPWANKAKMAEVLNGLFFFQWFCTVCLFFFIGFENCKCFFFWYP